uniref:Uncharacterized protein n=1 Tax=Trichobilharzia regenti TaxID=157069 RepID=A0AA85J9Q4_TRIRE|nr:unnamed protein product [Trichobilharzia regenti]
MFVSYASDEPIQHTGPVISADHLKVTDNLRICISGSTDGICTFWAIIGSTIPLNMEQTTSRFEFLRMNSITWKPLICLTNSYRQCKYPINSIVTQIWLTDDDENGKSTHYFIYIACGYEVWVLHIHLDYSILTSEINVENTIMQLFSTKGKLNISLSELSALWTSEKVAEIKKYNLDHVVVQMSAISQQPGVISQCGVVALLSNGEVVIMPYACEDDEFRHIRVQNDSLSNLWCTSLSTYAGGVLVAHAGSALFYPYADEKYHRKPSGLLISAFSCQDY